MEKIAQELKEEGNQCFREKRYNKAIQLYTASLEKFVDPVVLGNRAQAYIQLKHFQHAIMDCNKALEMNNKLTKPLYRRAVALESLGLFKQAKKDVERCLALVNDPSARSLLERVNNKSDLPCINVETCEKADEIRSDRPLIEISIECDEIQEEHPQPSTSQGDLDDVAVDQSESLPAPPTSFQSFLADYSLLKRVPAQFALYFLSIDPLKFNGLFDDLLDSDVVSCLLLGLTCCLESKNPRVQPLDVTKLLLQLTEVGRFDMIAMFLSCDDRKNLQRVCDFLAAVDAEAVMSRFTQ